MKPFSMTATLPGSDAALQLAHPLDEFYSQAGSTLPPIAEVRAGSVPQPYRQLLVHQNDMTPTLEQFHGRKLHLRVLGKRRKGNQYFREVVLLLDGTNQPVEFGAIKINLNLFSAEAQRHILEEQRPLGHIVPECAVQLDFSPRPFCELPPTALSIKRSD
jgi:hypothetical protein